MNDRDHKLERTHQDPSEVDVRPTDATSTPPTHVDDTAFHDETRTIPLREEELVARRETREVGEVVVRKEIERVPARLEVDALSEEVEVRHVPVGKTVDGRREPWQDGDTYVLPVYEEQMVVVKRLVLKEEVHVRRLASAEKRLFEETVEREHAVIEDSTPHGAVRERYSEEGYTEHGNEVRPDEPDSDRQGPLERLARKILD